MDPAEHLVPDTVSLSSDSSNSADVRLELLRGQHCLARAHVQLAALCSHLCQLQPNLRKIRGYHLAEWTETLAETLEEEAARDIQAGVPD